jgi:PAS domain S-box-containing protein
LQASLTEQNLFRYLVTGVKDYAIFALNQSGHIASWNPGAERIKGYKAEEVIGKHFSIFYSEEAKSQGQPDFELAEALTKGSYEEEGWRLRKDGSQFRADVVISTLYDEEGTHIGFAQVTRDLSERVKAKAQTTDSAVALGASENAFNIMIAAVKDYAIFSLTPEGIIESWNVGAQRIKGYLAQEIIGKHFSIFYTQEAKERKHPEYELEQAIKNGSYEEEGWRVRKDGQQIWASVTITPVFRTNGALKGFVKVTRDLTERKRYESELERARDEAILANSLKSRFVANVTHEIRTPLSGIVGLSQLIAQDTNLDRQTCETSTQIFKASKQLLVILNDLLDFAKLEAGKVELEHIPYDVAKVVDEVVGLSKGQAENKSLSISVTIDPQVPNIFVGDPNKLRQVLNNLVHNAIKFTENGGIEVFVEKQVESLFFSVADTGIGIALETQEKLFKPFVQAHESTTRLFGGTGLGLSISQQLVELMGGTIGLVSQPGQGTTIWFILPIRSSVAEGL